MVEVKSAVIDGDLLLGGPRRGGPIRNKKAFISYSMTNDASVAFCANLSDMLRRRDVQVSTGGMKGGEEWRTTIHGRVKDAHLVVADVSDIRPEVIYECGLARGKRFLPVVDRPESRDAVPGWLNTRHLPAYETSGISTVADAANAMFSQPAPRDRPKPVPDRALWIRGIDGSPTSEELATAVRMRENRIQFDVLNAETVRSPEDLRDVLASWLVFAIVDGGQQDYLTHFLVGDIAALGEAGSGKGSGERLARAACLVVKSREDAEILVPKSIQQLPKGRVTVGPPSEVAGFVHSRISLLRNFRAHRKGVDPNWPTTSVR